MLNLCSKFCNKFRSKLRKWPLGIKDLFSTVSFEGYNFWGPNFNCWAGSEHLNEGAKFARNEAPKKGVCLLLGGGVPDARWGVPEARWG